MSKKAKQMLVAYGLVTPAFLVVMLTVAYPIVSAVIQSFQDPKTGAFTWANYAYFFTEPVQRKNILYTLYVVIMTVVIALRGRVYLHQPQGKGLGEINLAIPRRRPAASSAFLVITAAVRQLLL